MEKEDEKDKEIERLKEQLASHDSLIQQLLFLLKDLSKKYDLPFPREPCLFDNMDFSKNPTTNMFCPCPKHSVR